MQFLHDALDNDKATDEYLTDLGQQLSAKKKDKGKQKAEPETPTKQVQHPSDEIFEEPLTPSESLILDIEEETPKKKKGIKGLLQKMNPSSSSKKKKENQEQQILKENISAPPLPDLHREEVEKLRQSMQSPPEEEKEQEGAGIGDSTGLWSDEIDKIMDKYKKRGYKGTVSIDQIGNIQFNPKDKHISFIMNTTPSTSNKSGHWIAVYMNHDNLEYYDSFGDDPGKQFMKNIKPLLQRWSPNKYLQFKINRVKKQNGNSNNCGYFAIKFLQDRYAGKHFKDCTDFKIIEDSIKGEKEIRTFKKKLVDFNYI